MPTILKNNTRPGDKTLINLKVGSTEVKYVKRGDGKLFYDTLNYYNYGTPSVSISYSSSSTSAAGGTNSVASLTYSQSRTPVGYSGTSYTATTLNSGATIQYSISGTGASINSSTGVVTWSPNQGNTERSATVTVSVTLNGKKGVATAVVKQNKDSVSSYVITLSSNNYTTSANACAYTGGTCTISAKVSVNWVSGNVTYQTPKLTVTGVGLTVGNISNYQATGTWGASTTITQRSAKITATYSGASDKSITLYQKANTTTSYEYETPTINTATAKQIPASGGTTSNSYYTVTYTQRRRIVYADGSQGSWETIANQATASSSMISADKTITGANLLKTTKAQTSLGTVTVYVTANSKKSSGKAITIYQQANVKTQQNSSLTVNLSYGSLAANALLPVSPSLIVKASGKYVWSSTSEEEYSNLVITEYSKSFQISSTTYFTINTSSGDVSIVGPNNSNSVRSATVTVTVISGGITKSATATVQQNSRKGYNISIVNSSSYEGPCAFSTSSSPTYSSNSQTVMHFEVLGNSTQTIINTTSLQCINSAGNATNVTTSGTTIYVVQLRYVNGNYQYTSVGSFTWKTNQNISVNVSLVY